MVDCLLTILVNQICRLFSTHQTPDSIIANQNITIKKYLLYVVTTDSSDNIYVTGNTLGNLDGNTNSGDEDIFLVKYDLSGTKQ